METAELVKVLNVLKDARDASDWRGRFTHDIRVATIEHRQVKIAIPLDEAIGKLQKELDSRTRKRKAKRVLTSYQSPYKDD